MEVSFVNLFWLKMDYTQILTQLRRLIRSVNLESKRIEKEYGVSIPQLLCMKFLSKSPDQKASQREIGDFLSLNASTITGIVNRLEKKGLVSRLPKGADRRVNFITLTSQGLDLIYESPELLHDRVTKKLQTFSDPELVKLDKAFDSLFELLDIPNGLPSTSNESPLPQQGDKE